MSTFVLLTITGLGLGAMYFLIASGLSLIYGLMGVLNFAHGAFLTIGAYIAWFADSHFTAIHSVTLRFVLAALCGLAAGAVFAALGNVEAHALEHVRLSEVDVQVADREQRPRRRCGAHSSSPR